MNEMNGENGVQHAKDEIDRTVGLIICMMSWIWAKKDHMAASDIFSKIHYGVPELEKSVGNREHFATMLLIKKPPTSESSERDIVYWMFTTIIALRYIFDTGSYSSEEYAEIKEYLRSKADGKDKAGFTYKLVGDEIEEFLCPHTPAESRSGEIKSSRSRPLQSQTSGGTGCLTVIVGAFFFGVILLLW